MTKIRMEEFGPGKTAVENGGCTLTPGPIDLGVSSNGVEGRFIIMPLRYGFWGRPL